MMRHFKCIVYCFLLILVTTTYSSKLLATPSFLPVADTANFVSLADIHFNPFYTCNKKNKNCPIINKLVIAPVAEWPSLFNQYDTQAPRYKGDTNYTLLKSTLQQLKKTDRMQPTQFVLVLGDFLSHDYKKNYQYFTGDTSEKGVQRFIDKTLEFICLELTKTFPHINIYMVVGNNDSYGEHYTSQAVFYKNIAPIWSALIHDKKNRVEMQKEFAQGGYYALNIDSLSGNTDKSSSAKSSDSQQWDFWQGAGKMSNRNVYNIHEDCELSGNTDKSSSAKSIRLIVLNTAYFSTRGKGMNQEAERELNWLGKQLRILDNTQTKALIALHIPNLAGVSISHDIPVAALGLWKARYIDQFLQLLKCSAPHIMAVLPAHLHVDWAQLLQFKGVAQTVLISATPSISPVVGNNPAYKIYYYDAKKYLLTDYLTYYYPLDARQWKLEYAFNQTYQPDCKVCTVANGLKGISKNTQNLMEYKKFFSVDRQIPIFSNLAYPSLVCHLQMPNDTEYKQCISRYCDLTSI